MQRRGLLLGRRTVAEVGLAPLPRWRRVTYIGDHDPENAAIVIDQESPRPVNRRDMLSALVLTPTGPVPVSLLAGAVVGPAFPQGDKLDNTLQIQTAIDALHKTGGGTLYLPAGTYRIRELRFRSHVALAGLGQAILKLFAPGRDGYMARIIGQSSICIDNLRFDCTVDAGRENTVGCVEVTFGKSLLSSDIKFRNCTFANAQNGAWVILRNVEKAKIENCDFLDHLRETEGGTHGLSIAEGSRDVRITDCRFDHPSGYRSPHLSRGCIGIDRATDVWINRCLIHAAPLNGITIEDNQEALVQNITIRDCVIRNCGNSGIQIEGNGRARLYINGCEISNNGSFGIRLAGGKELVAQLSDCILNDNSDGHMESGNSQLLINSGVGQTCLVNNCIFKSNSTSNQFCHVFFINGVTTVTNCTFSGARNGFGIYAPIDRQKQLQRNNAIFQNLRFFDIGIATFGIPQHAGNTWQSGDKEPSSLETTLTKRLSTSDPDLVFDTWIPIYKNTDSGSVAIMLYVLANSTTSVATNFFSLAIERVPSGKITISPSRELTGPTAGDSATISLSAVSILEDRGFKVRLTINVRDDAITSNYECDATVSVQALWNGFSSSPIFV